MSLRPAVPGRHGHRPHRIELIRPPRPVRARIDGQWQTAVATCRMQPRDGAAWEICLEYSPEPGQNGIAWFVEDAAHLRVDTAPEPGTPKIDQVPDAIPDDLIALQRAVYAAQHALHAYDGDDRDQHHRLRAAESQAVLALYRHPARASVNWRELMDAARADDEASSD